MSNAEKNISILLVEDAEIVRMIHMRLISGLNGGNVDVAETGEEALLKASNQAYDLIFMDIGLSGISGIQATAQIRELEKTREKKATIIGVTAYELEEVTEACLAAGMNAVFSKPIHYVLIRKLILEYTC